MLLGEFCGCCMPASLPLIPSGFPTGPLPPPDPGVDRLPAPRRGSFLPFPLPASRRCWVGPARQQDP